MKSRKQIEAYIKEAPWRQNMIYNLNHGRYSRDILMQVACLEGRWRETTITQAFDWSLTPEGKEYWEDVNREFTTWLKGR